MRKLIALLALSAALVGACGGSGDKTKNASATGDTTTTAKAAETATGGGANASFSDFCGAKAGVTAPNPAEFTSGDIKNTFEGMVANIDKAAKYAPAEIKGDVKVVGTAYKSFVSALASVNYDFSKVDPSKLQSIATPDVQAAAQRISAWVTAHCK
jgi:hypothetical protein